MIDPDTRGICECQLRLSPALRMEKGDPRKARRI